MDFNAYQPHVLSDGCADCKGRSFSQLCGVHRHISQQVVRIKSAVQQIARTAVEIGAVKRDNECNRCHRHVDLVSHHNDYNKPFEIEWLCGKCHAAHHAPERREALSAKREGFNHAADSKADVSA